MVSQAEIDAALGEEAEAEAEAERRVYDGKEPDTETTGGDADLGSIAGLPIVPVSSSIKYFNTLIYAESGTGKTVLAGSAQRVPDMAPVLLIDIEGGTMSLEDFYPDVPVVRVNSWTGLQKVYDRLYSGKEEYKTVIVDSLTEAQKFSMQEIMRKSVREDPTIDPDVPRMRDWGKNIEQMRRFTRAMRDLPMNVIFTALATVDKDDNTGKQITRPSFNGKLGAEIPAFMDTVLYMYIKEFNGGQQRLLLSKKTARHLAKDRSNRLPAVIEEPTMELIHGYMTGELEAPEPESKPAKGKAKSKG